MSSMGSSWASSLQNLVILGSMGRVVFCTAEKEPFDPLGSFHLQQLWRTRWTPAVGCKTPQLWRQDLPTLQCGILLLMCSSHTGFEENGARAS